MGVSRDFRSRERFILVMSTIASFPSTAWRQSEMTARHRSKNCTENHEGAVARFKKAAQLSMETASIWPPCSFLVLTIEKIYCDRDHK